MTSVSKMVTIAIVAISVAGLVWLAVTMFSNKHPLPVLGEPGHIAGAFAFLNQEGKTITQKDVAGKVTVAEYFFTTCPGICKVMNKNLVEVYEKFRGHHEFAILSHSVDPETDSVPVLAAYASRLKVSATNWHFLTGNKEALYAVARQEYLLAVEDTVITGTKDDFIHTEFVALLDRQRRIRGFYDATNKKSIDRLITDIKVLLDEKEE
jgi:protein SCO1/2